MKKVQPDKMKKRNVCFRLTEKMYTALCNQAKQNGLSLSEMAAKILEDHL